MSRPLTLRAKLTLAVAALLAAVTLALGFFTHALMSRTFLRQTDEQLQQAVSRAEHYRGTASAARATTPPDPLDAPGQGPGALNALVHGSDVRSAHVLDRRTGERTSLTAEDREVLQDVKAGRPPETVRLAAGKYRVRAVDLGSGQTLVTGLPLSAAEDALDSLSLIVVGVGATAAGAAAVVGMLVIRRELAPLERVAGVAGEASRLPLEAGEVRLAARVADRDARPGTEVGEVGHALNQLLDSVEGALEARQASETRVRRFVADASHELRNPLAAIRGYSDLLGATEHFSEDGLRSLGRLQAQSQRMGGLVEDLLLLARLDEGRTPTMADVDLTRLVLETANDFRVSAPDHEWRLELGDEPVSVRGDERQLHQVLTNLLSNARKHTDAGTRITAGARLSEDGRWALLSVEDNGQGIDPELQSRVFERFARADAARSGSDGTTGLGLSIVQAIARAHGGGVRVESAPGRTLFEVRLPVRG